MRRFHRHARAAGGLRESMPSPREPFEQVLATAVQYAAPPAGAFAAEGRIGSGDGAVVRLAVRRT